MPKECWAIKLNHPEYAFDSYAGILNWIWNKDIHLCQNGFRIATWRTRKEAREGLKTLRGFPNAKVVKVIITIEPAA